MFENIDKYLKIEELKNGGLYFVLARNFKIAIYCDKIKGFYGIRNKFGSNFIDIEYHWDTDPTFGTTKPIKLLEIFDENLIEMEYENSRHIYDDMFEYLKQKNDEFDM